MDVIKLQDATYLKVSADDEKIDAVPAFDLACLFNGGVHRVQGTMTAAFNGDPEPILLSQFRRHGEMVRVDCFDKVFREGSSKLIRESRTSLDYKTISDGLFVRAHAVLAC